VSAATIRPLTRADGPAFRTLRLEGLRLAPEAFTAAYEDEVTRSDEDFACRIPVPPSTLFGAFLGDTLVALTGLAINTGAKDRHKGMIWGVYVSPAGRGQGLARRLLDAAVAHARTVEGLELLHLGVGATNETAKAVYETAGFVPYGLERHALKLADGRYVDEELRVLDLTAD
jgi:ribosomal protein S18 acetylase RimI-like enzyme